MYKKDTVAQNRPPVRLASPPSVGEVGQIFSESMRQADTKLALCWPNSDKTNEFYLYAYFPHTSNEACWEFFYGTEHKKEPLWAYVTSDILLVYNLVAQAMHSVEQQTGSGRKKHKPEEYKDLYMLPTAYYSKAQDIVAESEKKHSATSHSSAQVTHNVMNGDLSDVDLKTICQSVGLARSTGRLVLNTLSGNAEIYFEQGLPVQASIGSITGDEAFLDVFIEPQGEFHFEPDVAAPKKNIRQKLDDLMLKGVLLDDKSQFLAHAGLKPDTILMRRQKDLAEAEFEKISNSVASGSYLTFSMTAQKEFYLAIDDRSNIHQIADKLRLTESQWIPLLCRMLKAGFVELVNHQPSEIQQLKPKKLDHDAIHSVMLSLRRPETSLYTFPAFSYFLDQEYLKARRYQLPLSLVILDARISGGNFEYRSPLPAPVLSELVRRTFSLKRDVDIVGHYEVFDVGIVLPSTDSAGAQTFAERLVQVLREPSLSNAPDTQISIAAGVASAPDHVTDLELLLAAAEHAKNTAQHTTSGVVVYSHPAGVQRRR